MIKKFFFCLVCILFVSCTPNRYTDEFTQISKENLLGRWSCLDTWSSNENYDKHLITLHFQDNDTIKYSEVPDPNANIVIAWAGIHLDYQYKVINDSLLAISYEPKSCHAYVENSFSYITECHIIDNILVISKFSFDGKCFKRIELKKE